MCRGRGAAIDSAATCVAVGSHGTPRWDPWRRGRPTRRTMTYARTQPDHPRFDFAALKRERVADQCVCCGSTRLASAPAVLMPFIAHRAFGWEPVVIDDSWGLRRSATAPPIRSASPCCASGGCGLLFLDIRFSGSSGTRPGSDETTAARSTRGCASITSRATAAAMPSSAPAPATLAAVEAFLRPYLTAPIRALDWGATPARTRLLAARRKPSTFSISAPRRRSRGRRRSARPRRCRSAIRSSSAAMCRARAVSVGICCSTCAAPWPASTVLYIEVPFEALVRANPGADDLHLRKRHWHEHINFYSERSLRRLFDNTGFRPLAIETLAVETGDGTAYFFQLACVRQ